MTKLCLLSAAAILFVSIALIEGIRAFRGPDDQANSADNPAILAQSIETLQRGKDESARAKAALAITAAGSEAVEQALDAIAKVSDDDSMAQISRPAVVAMANVGSPATESLCKALSSSRRNVRVAAADVLRTMGPEASDTVAPLEQALNDKSRWVRWYATEALGNIGPDAAPATNALITLIEHDERQTRQRAIEALGRIGPPAKAAVSRLEAVRTDDRYGSVRKAARVALHQINLADTAATKTAAASDAVRALLEKVARGDQFESVAAARQLGEMGPAAVSAIPALAVALAHENKWIREAAAESLGMIGSSAKSVLPALQKATSDPEPEVQQAARRAIGRIVKEKGDRSNLPERPAGCFAHIGPARVS